MGFISDILKSRKTNHMLQSFLEKEVSRTVELLKPGSGVIDGTRSDTIIMDDVLEGKVSVMDAVGQAIKTTTDEVLRKRRETAVEDRIDLSTDLDQGSPRDG